MINLQIRDGKRQNRTLDINGFIKPSGTIVASVTNDRGETYFVQVRTDGTTVCEHIVNGKRVGCLGHFHTGGCYHVNAVIADALPTFEEVTDTLELVEIDTAPNADGNYRNLLTMCMDIEKHARRTPVDLDIVRTFKAEDAYEQLGASKDPWAGLSEDEKVTAYGYYLMGIGA